MNKTIDEETKAALEKMISDGVVSRESAAKYFPELKESEGEKARKEIIAILKYKYEKFPKAPRYSNVPKWIDWLEKQGEQNTIDKIQIGKKYKCIASPRYSTFMIGEIYKPEDKFLCSLMNLCYNCFKPIEDVEQKSADKVEPKFKVGDWIISHYNNVAYIESISETKYNLRCKDGYHEKLDIDCINRNWRLWTIQDAKDGDVLVASDGSIFLFKGRVYSACKHYVALTTDGAVKFNEGLEHYWETVTAVHPATKEQRDLLFKKMHEAGYEWDAEKLELRQTKDVFPLTEDIEMLESIINDVKQRADLESEQIDWLVSLRENLVGFHKLNKA